MNIVLFLLLSPMAFSQTRIIAKISNLKNDKGVCRACLFNNPASFKGDTGEPFKCESVRVKNQNTLVSFENVPAGSYAMFVFHDENNNNKMDKNFVGIPKEGYGASKNKLPFAAAPTFEENAFTVNNQSILNLQIKLRYLW